MVSSRIQAAIELLKEEADTIDNPDPVSRLYAAKMKLEAEIIKIMCEIRHKERQRKDGNEL